MNKGVIRSGRTTGPLKRPPNKSFEPFLDIRTNGNSSHEQFLVAGSWSRVWAVFNRETRTGMTPIPTNSPTKSVTSARRTNDMSPPWRCESARIGHVTLALMIALQATACSTVDSVSQGLFGGGPSAGQQGYVKGFLGQVVADEPRAALAGKEVLSAGGNAADAAVTIALSLGVTLPSRAGLGGGGACVAYSVSRKNAAGGTPESILFVSPAVRSVGGGDRPTSVPSLARGVFLLHARHGKLSFDSLVARAEQLAREGVAVSGAFARDLALVAGPLLADPGARAAFGPTGVPLTEGQGMTQPELAATFAQIRVAGVGDLHQGILARRIEQGSGGAGIPIGGADLRAALPSVMAPAIVSFGDDKVAFAPTDGGIGAAAGFQALIQQPANQQAAYTRGLAAAARWHQGGISADQVLNAALPDQMATPSFPASTTFGALDPNGNAVICAVTMNNLFGTGRMVPGLGFLAAASPAFVPAPLLAAGLAWNPRKEAFRAAAGGSGQAGASLAVAVALSNMLRTQQPMSALVPGPGRANVISCAGYLPGSEKSCGAVADPREPGLAAGGG